MDAASDTSQSIDVTIACLCSRHRHTYRLPLPLPALRFVTCHCDSCRHSSGTLNNSALDWTHPLISSSTSSASTSDDLNSTRDLVEYDFGPNLKFWFCGICSTKLYWRYKKPDSPLEIFPPVLPEEFVQRPDVDLKCSGQYHVLDTLDGGSTSWFVGAGESKQPAIMYKKDTGSDVVHAEDSRLAGGAGLGQGGDVNARCHCGGIDFQVVKKDGHRFPVLLDDQASTRLFASHELSAWAEIPWSVVKFAEYPAIEDNHELSQRVDQRQLGTLAKFEDKDAQTGRFFCQKCSACVFVLESLKGGMERGKVKVAVGLFHSRLGARAEDVFMWPIDDISLPQRGIAYTVQ